MINIHADNLNNPEGREGKELSVTQTIMYAIQLDSKFTKCNVLIRYSRVIVENDSQNSDLSNKVIPFSKKGKSRLRGWVEGQNSQIIMDMWGNVRAGV